MPRVIQPTFKIDYEALDNACWVLGLERPVKIRMQGNLIHYGQYGYLDVKGRHKIVLRSVVPSVIASVTLWHELTHAQQVERFGLKSFQKLYMEEVKRLGLPTQTRWWGLPQYEGRSRKISFEVDASKNNNLHSWLPLAEPV